MKENDMQGIREHYLYRLIRSRDIYYYHLLKESYGDDTAGWESMQTRVLDQAAASGENQLYIRLLKEEKLASRLLKHLEKHPVYDDILLAVPAVMREHGPAVLALLRQLLLKEAVNSRSKEGARGFMQMLKQVRKLPEGKVMVSEMLGVLFAGTDPVSVKRWKILKEMVGGFMA